MEYISTVKPFDGQLAVGVSTSDVAREGEAWRANMTFSPPVENLAPPQLWLAS